MLDNELTALVEPFLREGIPIVKTLFAGSKSIFLRHNPEVRKRTDALDALGNTTAATGKGFAIGSAALTALALLASYIEEVKIGLLHIGETSITLSNGTVKAVTRRS